MTTVLSVDDLVAGYGDSKILNGLSMDVSDREIVAVVGPNGAGKSTLLKAIVGLVRTQSGGIIFEGTPITGEPTESIIRRGIGYVPQVANVFPSLSVRENLELALPAATRKSAAARQLGDVLEMFPALTPRLKMRANTLSGGERQMLALARALTTRPRLLLLDEPTAAVAPVLVDAIFAKVQEIHREHAVSVVLVEQNAKKALNASHRGYVLEGGRQALSGPTSDLLSNPLIQRLYLGGDTRNGGGS